MSTTHSCPRRTCCLASAIAVWQLRPGRNPWLLAWNVGSYSGSRTCRTASITTRSATFGIPSPRCPPPALGIIARRISPGRYVPSSRSARNFGAIVGHCSRSMPTVSPSGPGAPLFTTTFFIADSSRSTTPSIIIAGEMFPSVTIAFGTLVRPARDRSRATLRADPSGSSAVAIGSWSCPAVCSTGTAFPCPPTAGWTGITPPSGTTRSSDFCWAISRRYRRPTRPREPNRSPRVNR